jgi:hypothetical protein
MNSIQYKFIYIYIFFLSHLLLINLCCYYYYYNYNYYYNTTTTTTTTNNNNNNDNKALGIQRKRSCNVVCNTLIIINYRKSNATPCAKVFYIETGYHSNTTPRLPAHPSGRLGCAQKSVQWRWKLWSRHLHHWMLPGPIILLDYINQCQVMLSP